MNSFYWKSLCLTFVFLYVPIAGSEDHFKVKVPPELVAVVGNEITLPCRLNTNTNISTVVWSRRDLSHSDVLRYNYEAGNKVNNSYKGRVSDLNREELERGIASIRLIHVQRSDEGEYKCTVTARMWADEATIRLSVIGVGSRPEIWKLEAVEGGLWLQCRSNGWFPKPEMFWLDSDGRNLTSESGNVPKFNYTLVEGLYTVTGEVAVTRGDANRFLCRIHFQKNNLTTETEINISGNTFPNSDDLFWKLWDIYKTTAAFSGLVILLIIPGFILHKKGVFERLGYFSKQLRFLKYRNPPGYEDIIQNRVSVKLDSCRAHSHLRVDCDCEQVSYQGPGSPQSQQQSKCEYGVLGTNQFSGKHYFEVKFEGSWVVGVARDPIDITSTINYGHDAWTLSRNNGKLRVHNGSLVLLSDQQKSDTMYIMGVYVDYQDKRVSFYNVNPNVRPCHIYSYTECDFSENLCPFFRTWNARRNVLKVNNTDNAAKDGKCEEELSIY